MGMTETLEDMLAQGKDNAMLRYSLGNAYFGAGEFDKAVDHFKHAVQQDSNYSAAWKMYGRALEKRGDIDDAIEVFEKGISVAEKKKDMQAVKEMNVFLKRLKKAKE